MSNVMMTNTKHAHHQEILSILQNLNSKYLEQEGILFAGGTRITLEINEYRLSDDIDFFCVNREAFKKIRDEISPHGDLSQIAKIQLPLLREPRFSRESVQLILKTTDKPIKMEFILADELTAKKSLPQSLPVPHIDRDTCYTNKLMTLSNRFADAPYKDFFDLLAMKDTWGSIPFSSIEDADKLYGLKSILGGFKNSFSNLKHNPTNYFKAASKLKIDEGYSDYLLKEVSTKLELEYLTIEHLRKENFLTQESLANSIGNPPIK